MFLAPVVEDDSGNTSAISDDEAPTSRHTEFSTDAENNLTCCILMLDILLKQVTNYFLLELIHLLVSLRDLH